MVLVVSIIAVGMSHGAQPVLVDDFVNGVTDSNNIKGFWKMESVAGGSVTERDNYLKINLSGEGGAKYAAIRSRTNAKAFDFFSSRKVMYVKKMRKTGDAAGRFRFEVTDAKESFRDASNAIWVEVNGKEIELFVKENNEVNISRALALENECILFILELSNTHYFLKSYCQVKRPGDAKRKNQIRVRTMSGMHGIEKGEWGKGGGSFLGVSAERTSESGRLQYELAELRVVNFRDISAPKIYYDVFAKGAPPGVSAKDPFYKKGILNVRNPPYNAVGDGTHDDTVALQNAIIDAYEFDLITYIPGGTYLISDKLMGVQKAIIKKPGDWDVDGYDVTGTFSIMNGKSYRTFTVYGDEKDPPIIKLKDGAVGFDSRASVFSPGKQREIFQFWSQPNGVQQVLRNALSEDPVESSTGLLYNIVVRDLRIDMGKNFGAIGFQVAGSQGCTISNIHVFAPEGYGFACFRDLGGVGGGNVGLTGIGCKYGIYITKGGSSYPHVTGLHLENQTVESISCRDHAPFIVTGAKIIKEKAPVATLHKGHYSGCHISLVDTEIQFRRESAGKAFVNENNRNLHLHNVYIKNADILTKDREANGKGWTHVIEYGFNDKNANGLVNGERTSKAGEVYADINRYASGPQFNFVLRHLPKPEDIPGIHDIVGSEGNNGFAVSIKDSRIVGDKDDTDWHAEIQEALDKFSIIYIPRGNYKISKPLVLRADSKLFGLGPKWSGINTHSDWKEPANTAMIQAPANTNPVISDFRILADVGKRNSAVLWQGGARSVSRTIRAGTGSSKGKKVSAGIQVWKFTGQAGGRHYGNIVKAAGYKDYETLRLIQIVGTKKPLAIYGINSETSFHPHHEIVDAQNVYLLGIKNEAGGLVLRVTNSSNILVAGQGGNLIPKNTNDGIIHIMESCDNISVANICPLKKKGAGYTLKVGSERIEYSTLVSLMKKGNTPMIGPFALAEKLDSEVKENGHAKVD